MVLFVLFVFFFFFALFVPVRFFLFVPHKRRDHPQIKKDCPSFFRAAPIRVHLCGSVVVLLFLGLSPPRLAGPRLPQILPQLPSNRRVPQSAQRLRLDLAHALARHAHLAPHLFQRVSLPVQQPVA
jgi:hypothetical protein